VLGSVAHGLLSIARLPVVVTHTAIKPSAKATAS
jgi:hypothetical protein